MKWETEKEELNRLINNEKVPYEEIGRRYNCSGSNIKKVARKLGIELPQKRQVNECETFNKNKTLRTCPNCGKQFNPWLDKKQYNIYCCQECASEHRHKQLYKKYIENQDEFCRANYSLRLFKEEFLKEQNDICAICGCKQEHNGKPLVFIMDHIDGDASNNRRENIRLICPNCDSQLNTYKSKNKNSARRQYRYKLEEEVKKLREQVKQNNLINLNK